MAVVTAPNYDNVLWPGADGLRVPQEVGSASLSVVQMNTINCSSIGGSATTNAITLAPFLSWKGDVAGSGIAAGAEASVLVFTGAGSGATTVSLPAAFPGNEYIVRNNSGQNVVFKVTGQTGVTVATGSAQAVHCTATDIRPTSAAVAY